MVSRASRNTGSSGPGKQCDEMTNIERDAAGELVPVHHAAARFALADTAGGVIHTLASTPGALIRGAETVLVDVSVIVGAPCAATDPQLRVLGTVVL
jgi:hypothetical protein